MHVTINITTEYADQIVARWAAEGEDYDLPGGRASLTVAECQPGIPYWIINALPDPHNEAIVWCGYHQYISPRRDWHAWVTSSGAWAWVRRTLNNSTLVLAGPRPAVLELVDRAMLAEHAQDWYYSSTEHTDWAPWETWETAERRDLGQPDDSAGATDWARLRTLEDDEIDSTDIPEPTPEQLAGAEARPGLRKREWIGLWLDADVLAWLRAQGPSYRVLINAALREHMRACDSGEEE